MLKQKEAAIKNKRRNFIQLRQTILDARAVDKLYRAKKFESERERVEHLFALYEQLTAPMLAAAAPKKRRAGAGNTIGAGMNGGR